MFAIFQFYYDAGLTTKNYNNLIEQKTRIAINIYRPEWKQRGEWHCLFINPNNTMSYEFA